MKLHTGHLGKLLIAALGSSGVACASDFANCESSKACAAEPSENGGMSSSGSGGTTSVQSEGAPGGADEGAGAEGGAAGDEAAGAAEGGAGGDGELPPLPEACASAEDCDDGLWCTGTETCSNGECAYGEPPCANDEPFFCSVSCTEGAEGPICGVVANDDDGDGHGDNRCSAAPGDDCNDEPDAGASIHPGAAEICNENVDDDCDGVSEAADEVLLMGSAQVLAAPLGTTKRDQPTIAAMNAGGFGVAWADWRDEATGVTSEIYYRSLGADGTAGDEVRLTSSTTWYDNRAPDLSFHDTGFGLALRGKLSTSGDEYVRFANVSADGSNVSGLATAGYKNVLAVSGGPKLNWDSYGSTDAFRVTWPSATALTTALVGSLTTTDLVTGAIQHFEVFPDRSYLASHDDGSGKYVTDVNADAGFSTISSVFSETSTHDILDAVGAFSDAQALNKPFLTVSRFKSTSGSSTNFIRLRGYACVEDFQDGIPIDIVGTTTGWVFLYWDPNQESIRAQTMNWTDTSCVFGPSALVVKEDGFTIGSAALARDAADNLAVVWSAKDDASGEWTIFHRLFHPALCE